MGERYEVIENEDWPGQMDCVRGPSGFLWLCTDEASASELCDRLNAGIDRAEAAERERDAAHAERVAVAERVVVLEEQFAEHERRIARWERTAASEGGEGP